jgi:hypothetical protein
VVCRENVQLVLSNRHQNLETYQVKHNVRRYTLLPFIESYSLPPQFSPEGVMHLKAVANHISQEPDRFKGIHSLFYTPQQPFHIFVSAINNAPISPLFSAVFHEISRIKYTSILNIREPINYPELVIGSWLGIAIPPSPSRSSWHHNLGLVFPDVTVQWPWVSVLIVPDSHAGHRQTATPELPHSPKFPGKCLRMDSQWVPNQ